MNGRVELLLFTAGWGANHFSTLLVVYRKDLGLSPSALGILFGVYALGLVPGLVLAGRASDRRGRRTIVLPASVAAIGASAVLAFGAHGFGVLLAGRLLYGLAMGAVMSPGSVWVRELSSASIGARRATLALSAGFGFGPLLSGLIAEFAPTPMVLPYVAHIVAMAVALIVVRPVPETATGATAPASALPVAESARTAAHGIDRRTFLTFVEILPLAPWAFGFASVSMAILPGLMRAWVDRPVLYSAFVIMTTLMSGVLAQPLAKRLGHRSGLLGLAAGTVGIFLGSHAVAIGSPRLVFGVAALVGLGYGLVMTTGLHEISERVPKQSRGTAVGVYYVMTYLGFSLPFIHATAAKRLGDVRTLAVAGTAALGCLVIRAVVEARRRSGAIAGLTEQVRN